MKNYISRLYSVIIVFVMMACLNVDAKTSPLSGNNSSNGENNTLIVYYSYTNNTKQIVDDLKTLIDADVIEVMPANKNLNYAANNYAIGTEQLNKIKNNPNAESSYPAIDPVTVDMSKYNTVIIATPLWWSQMASNMQTFLFKYGKEMAGKNIGLIVSSHSSGISGVEADEKRLVENGSFFTKNLWINASQHSKRKALLEQWLKDINFNDNVNNDDNTMNLKVNSSTMKVKLADKAAVKAITDGLRIDVAESAVRVTNLKPGLVETNFSNVRFHGDNERADNVYKGIKPLTGADIADVAFYAASAPKHVQIAEVLILATHQASGSVIHRDV